MIWHKQNLEQDSIRKLSKKLGIDVLLSSILMRRGLSESTDLLYFLESSERYLHNPFLLSEMADAAERVLMAIEEGEQILIFGDRDVDGISSTAILYHGLLALGIQQSNMQYRNSTAEDIYGLSTDVVNEAAEQGITLIVTVDCGCANHKEIIAAQKLYIDVVVLDHHTPKEQRPEAYALVNPHSSTTEQSPYPFKNICAASVVGKFLWALAYMKESEGNSQRFCLLDIATTEDGKTLVRAAKLQNLCLHSQLELELKVPEDHQRLYQYIQNEVLVSFTVKATRQALSNIYGNSCDIYLLDFCQELLRQFPSLAEKLRKSGALQNAVILRQELLRLSRQALYRKLDTFESQVELLISILLHKMEIPRKILNQSLDLMAIASIADMMPLQNENRIIVQLGLAKLMANPRPGLRELLLELGMLGQDLNVKELSWKVIPILNSAGRMGHTEVVTDLLMAKSSDERREKAQQLIQLNQERRERSEQFQMLAQAPAQQSFIESNGQLVYVALSQLSRGITGIIAARLSQQYKGILAIVLCENNGTWSGSIRSNGEQSVLSLMESLAELGLFDGNYGGHQAAGGFWLHPEKQEQLWPELLKLLPLTEVHRSEETYDIDAEIPLAILGPSLLQRLWQPLAPYGITWPELLLFSKGLLLEDVQPIGRSDAGHLRLILNKSSAEQNEEQNLFAVFWNSAERHTKDFTKGDIVDILYRIKANYYQGQMKFQLEIVDIRQHAT